MHKMIPRPRLIALLIVAAALIAPTAPASAAEPPGMSRYKGLRVPAAAFRRPALPARMRMAARAELGLGIAYYCLYLGCPGYYVVGVQH